MSQTEKQLANALIKACEAALQKSPSGNIKAVTDALQAAKEFYGIEGDFRDAPMRSRWDFVTHSVG